jgi:hypothetical protein
LDGSHESGVARVRSWIVQAGREAEVEGVWVYADVPCDDTHAIREYKNFTDFWVHSHIE